MHLVCPPILCITIVFNFSWVIQCMVLREIKRRCFFKILGDKQRKLMWETAVSPFCANRQAYSGTRKKEKALLTCIDIAVPSESNTSAKFTEKLSKYQVLEIEINRMWETNKNNYAVKPILTANFPSRPPLYNAFFFSG